jgi:2-polyprenyl-3-methyl-5-hydroxy-6-metoxy-1,4-benzoquinol methylase
MRARPLFPGHYQPHVPSELGFYDLRVPEVRQAQADLARQYGIYGFCYYHYWFHGKRLLEKPFQQVLDTGKPDFPFALCWANEPWTRNWDAVSGHTLIGQRHSDEDDLLHIRWLLEAFSDRRYIKIDGRPLILVYRARKLEDSQRTMDLWRREAQRAGFPDLYLCKVESHGDDDDPVPKGFDANVGFLPAAATRLLEPFEGFRKHVILDYGSAAFSEMTRPPVPYKRFPAVVPNWDNTARRRTGAIVFSGSTPEAYENWLRRTVESVADVRPEEKLVFLVAWNEWAEGNHLEPDERYGRRYLEATKRALLGSDAVSGREASSPDLGSGETGFGPTNDAKAAPFDYEYRYEGGTAASQIVELARDLLEVGRTVADLGAGAAVVSGPLREMGFRYHGMDIHPEALRLMEEAGIATSKCDLNDSASVVNCLDELDDIAAVLMIDVLEHLVEPQQLLWELSTWSRANGCPYLLISVPNVAHFDVALRLLVGRWNPTKTGLLDSTHVRFFYRDTLRRLCERAGWAVVEERDVHVVRSDQHDTDLVESLPPSALGALRVLSETFNANATVQQYVWVLSPNENPSQPESYLEAIRDLDDVQRPMDPDDPDSRRRFRKIEQYMESVGILSAEELRREQTRLAALRSGFVARSAVLQLLAQVGQGLIGDAQVVQALTHLAALYGARDDLQQAFGAAGVVDGRGLVRWGAHAVEVGDHDGPSIAPHLPVISGVLEVWEAARREQIPANVNSEVPWSQVLRRKARTATRLARNRLGRSIRSRRRR